MITITTEGLAQGEINELKTALVNLLSGKKVFPEFGEDDTKGIQWHHSPPQKGGCRHVKISITAPISE
jgi:hypothetical protein